MDKALKKIGKAIVRDAMEVYRAYDRYNIAYSAEKSLFIHAVLTGIEHMPNIGTFDRFHIREYVDGMLERLTQDKGV